MLPTGGRNLQLIHPNSTNSEAGEKINADLESLEFYICFNECLTTFKSNQILLNISHHFLVTNTLFSRWNIPINFQLICILKYFNWATSYHS